jgi:hypothetical protein
MPSRKPHPKPGGDGDGMSGAVRTAREVFEDHLALAQAGDVETDIDRNFAPDCILLTSEGVFEGREGVRRAAALLSAHLPGARFRYLTRIVVDEIAFLEWTGDSDRAVVRDGADSFVIRDGLIRYMTAHYTVERRSEVRLRGKE